MKRDSGYSLSKSELTYHYREKFMDLWRYIGPMHTVGAAR